MVRDFGQFAKDFAELIFNGTLLLGKPGLLIKQTRLAGQNRQQTA